MTMLHFVNICVLHCIKTLVSVLTVLAYLYLCTHLTLPPCSLTLGRLSVHTHHVFSVTLP